MHKVMIVDDEATIREKLPRLVDFESHGFQVCATAKNGLEALEFMERHRPDLVLLDVRMPVLDGFGFLEKLTDRQWKESSVIILSGYSDFEYARRAMKFGIKGYLTKPVDTEEACKCLREVAQEIDMRDAEKRQAEYRQLLAQLRKATTEGVYCNDEYFILHILPRMGGQPQDPPALHKAIDGILSDYLQLEGGDIFNTVSFFLHSYLVPYGLAGQAGGTVEGLVASIDGALRARQLDCILMWDTDVLRCGQPFMPTYHAHLEKLLRAAFYSDAGFLDWNALPALPEAGGTERVGSAVEALRAAVEALLDEEAFAALESLGVCIQSAQYEMDEIDNIATSIHYLLCKQLNESALWGQEVPVLDKPTWRELGLFYGYETWYSFQKKKLATTLDFLHRNGKPTGCGERDEWLQYVQQHFKEPITLRHLAEQFHMNPAYMGRMFQKAVGMNFKQYLAGLRVAEAKKMLRTTDKYIYQIADELGFSESSYFIAKFTQAEGVSPMEYRNR